MVFKAPVSGPPPLLFLGGRLFVFDVSGVVGVVSHRGLTFCLLLLVPVLRFGIQVLIPAQDAI